ncbi:Fanconi anemia core complex-associated protein 24 [Octopus bimaculoides]|uniref:Fanconi anemia core complex-associated protein 24 pseudonuclease domain-containing protein n=1 Tax=Octopus bimaculoides TaxID=37653 RepID=A0A0L8GGV8_OCTBM|nr:Fanconi anemia core complex-associated protein 24 [Octopus bimaculoides]|eukprot:XP_014781236.1 PREDICTED: Fanconi anemia core complex-associated protein 24-like [Octopus bimaculoides]
MNISNQLNTQQNKTSVEPENKIVPNHIMVNSRWCNSELVTKIQATVRVLFFDDKPDIDFRPSNNVCVVYVSEAELVSQATAYKKKMVRLRKADAFKIIVVAEKTPMTTQYYANIQNFCVFELGLVLLPVSSQADAAGIITQLFYTGTQPEKNPFKRKRNSSEEDQSSSSLLATLQCIPGLGVTNAKLLLVNFGSIKAIIEASFESLSNVVGKSIAARIIDFLS